MNRKHVAVISVLIALAAAAGLVGILRTSSSAASSGAGATDALVQARTAQLDAVERTLRAQVARLDAVTTPAPAANATAAGEAPAAAGEKVVYVRPAPIVRTIHRGEGREQGEAAEHESGEDRGGEDD